jgi:hypothetical protein
LNSIILIGNGFDLAHGLKTSYKDFIDDFWEGEKKKVIEGLDRNTENYPVIFHKYEDEIIHMISPCDIKDLPKTINTNIKGYKWFKELSDSKFTININGKDITIKFTHKNNFIKTISEKTYLQKWVDIEEEYYFALNECLNGKREGEVEKLNKDFLIVQKALELYLINQTAKGIKASANILTNFKSIINSINIDKTKSNFTYGSILFLNFNYTSTERQYIDDLSQVFQNDIECVHIHGELEDPNNPIIFGYGDEIDDNYKLIEKKNDNGYLENVKSIKYLETDNYKKMLSFITSDGYQIFIMGHSCGISDRTLINTLFEHENCKSIRVFYHKKTDGTDNYSDVIRNISRNFTNKALMRERVVNKKDSEPIT